MVRGLGVCLQLEVVGGCKLNNQFGWKRFYIQIVYLGRGFLVWQLVVDPEVLLQMGRALGEGVVGATE